MLPTYLRKATPKLKNIRLLRSLIDDENIHSVCEEAKCPNIGECFERQTCAFIILGKICTRNCAFCGVSSGQPSPPDPTEPERIARAVEKLKLSYVVITSVTRDDLPDGGAGHFARVINSLPHSPIPIPHSPFPIPHSAFRIEVLIPDFQGSVDALLTVLNAQPYILNHNVETVPRLYSKIRPQADFKRSLRLLKMAKKLAPDIYTKSGFMVGLGEKDDEVEELLWELKKANCDFITIGQYLPPSRLHSEPVRYVAPETFAAWKKIAEGMGFIKVSSGPFVRSSYQAREIIDENR